MKHIFNGKGSIRTLLAEALVVAGMFGALWGAMVIGYGVGL